MAWLVASWALTTIATARQARRTKVVGDLRYLIVVLGDELLGELHMTCCNCCHRVDVNTVLYDCRRDGRTRAPCSVFRVPCSVLRAPCPVIPNALARLAETPGCQQSSVPPRLSCFPAFLLRTSTGILCCHSRRLAHPSSSSHS